MLSCLPRAKFPKKCQMTMPFVSHMQGLLSLLSLKFGNLGWKCSQRDADETHLLICSFAHEACRTKQHQIHTRCRLNLLALLKHVETICMGGSLQCLLCPQSRLVLADDKGQIVVQPKARVSPGRIKGIGSPIGVLFQHSLRNVPKHFHFLLRVLRKHSVLKCVEKVTPGTLATIHHTASSCKPQQAWRNLIRTNNSLPVVNQ